MGSRLSKDQLTSVRDGGTKSLFWRSNPPSGFLAEVDLDAILAVEGGKKVLQALPPQTVLVSLRAKGLLESQAALAALSGEQFTRILDLDLWRDDRLVPERFYEWIEAYEAVSQAELSRRFIELEEEYQLAILSSRVKVFAIETEEYDQLSDQEKDQLNPMPCQKVWYQILGDERDQMMIERLFQAVREDRLSYAYSLLSHAAYQIPQEAEFLLNQFRTARLEEEGFVSDEEAAQIFLPFNLEPISLKWIARRSQSNKAVQEASSEAFLARVLNFAHGKQLDQDAVYQLHLSLLQLANTLCSASGIEACDTKGLHALLEQAQGLAGLGIEYLSGGDVELGLSVLEEEGAKVCFSVGLSLVHGLRLRFVERLLGMKVGEAQELFRLYRSNRFGALQDLLSDQWEPVFGRSFECIRGLFNRYPMCPMLMVEEGPIEFFPLLSLQRLRDLKSYLEAVCGVVSLAGGGGLSGLSQKISRLLLKLLVSKPEDSESFKQMIKEFIALEPAQVSSRIQGLEEKVRTLLEHKRSEWGFSEDRGQELEATYLGVRFFLNEWLVGLLEARKHSFESVQALVAMATKEESE